MSVAVHKPTREVVRLRSVLIVLMGSLGDVVRGLSLVHRLKIGAPGVRISWVVEPKCEEIVRAHPEIDRVIVFNRKRGISDLPRVRRELRSEPFDLVLDLQRHFKSGVVSLLSGAPRRIGFHRKNAKEGNWLFSSEQIPEFPLHTPKLTHYHAFLDQLGIPSSAMDFGLTTWAASSDRTRFALPPNYLVFVLGSAWESKNWPAEGYSQLCEMVLKGCQHSIVLVGDSTVSGIATQLEQKFASPRIRNLTSQTSLRELAGILHGAQACVGPDSGPGHIASALSRPYIALYGPTDPRIVSFYGNEELQLQAPVGCSPCYRRQCPGLDKLCMRLLSAESVYAALRSALGLAGQPGPL